MRFLPAPAIFDFAAYYIMCCRWSDETTALELDLVRHRFSH